jgi:hypothetical protein
MIAVKKDKFDLEVGSKNFSYLAIVEDIEIEAMEKRGEVTQLWVKE